MANAVTELLFSHRHLPLRLVCPPSRRRTGWRPLVGQLKTSVDKQTYRTIRYKLHAEVTNSPFADREPLLYLRFD